MAKLENESLREALKNLYEFGFTDFSVNHALMLKHQSVDTVANTLMSGALSESLIHDIYM